MKTTPLILISLLAIASCDRPESTTETAAPIENSTALTAIFTDVAAGEPVVIHEARKTAKPGDRLLIKGRVMGSVSPFVEGRAAFVLGDGEILTACSDMGEDDHCETPWDACCDTKENLRDGTATIQVTGPDGRVLKEGIEGVQGLNKLSRVVIEGVVAEGSSPENFVINATVIDVAD